VYRPTLETEDEGSGFVNCQKKATKMLLFRKEQEEQQLSSSAQQLLGTGAQGGNCVSTGGGKSVERLRRAEKGDAKPGRAIILKR